MFGRLTSESVPCGEKLQVRFCLDGTQITSPYFSLSHSPGTITGQDKRGLYRVTYVGKSQEEQIHHCLPPSPPCFSSLSLLAMHYTIVASCVDGTAMEEGSLPPSC